MKINFHSLLALCLVKLTFSLPRFDEVIFAPEPQQRMQFQIAPGVESVIFKPVSNTRNSNSPLILGHDTRGRQANKPGRGIFHIGVDRSRVTTPDYFVLPAETGSGNENSGENNTVIVDITADDFVDGSGGGIETGSGHPADINPILFPFLNDPTHSSSTVSSTSSTTNKCTIESGEVNFQDSCYRLLKRGPCSEGQWLIINKEGNPYCADRPCPSEQLYYDGKCVSTADSSVCGRNEVLYVDFTGNVYCDCQPEFVYDSSVRQCFAEHERGSCPFGKYLELDSEGKLQCASNPCMREDLVFDPLTNKCYQKLFRGRCGLTEVSTLMTFENGTAACYSILNRNIFEVPALSSCPAGSKRDYFGNCRAIFRLNPDSSDNPFSYRVPTQYTSRYSACPPDYTKFPDGTCKKVNDFFG